MKNQFEFEPSTENYDGSIDMNDADSAIESMLDLFADVQDTERLADEVMDVTINMDNFDVAVENLMTVQAILEEHGANAALMALVDNNDSLSNAVRVALPKVVEGSNESHVTELATEGIKDKMKGAYDAVAKFLKDLWDRMVIFFKGMFNTNKKLLLHLVRYRDGILKESDIDDEAFGKAEMGVLTEGNLKGLLDGVKGLAGAMANKDLSEGTKELKEFSGVVALVGYEVKDDTISSKSDFWKTEKKQLKDLGYDIAKVKTHVNSAIEIVKDSNKLKAAQSSLDKAVKDGIKACADIKNTKDESGVKAKKEEIDSIKKGAGRYAKLASTYNKAAQTGIRQLLSVCAKIKKKKSKKD